MIEIKISGSNLHDLRLELSALNDVMGLMEFPEFTPEQSVALAAEAGLAPPGTRAEAPKRKRRTRAELIQADPPEAAPPPAAVIEKLAETIPEPAPAAPQKGFLDDDEPAAPVKVYEIADVRAALVGLQTKRHGQLAASGKDQAVAALEAEAAAKKVLVEAGGAERLKELKPENYGAVIEAANKAAAQ
jgi:hypothetical protein